MKNIEIIDFVNKNAHQFSRGNTFSWPHLASQLAPMDPTIASLNPVFTKDAPRIASLASQFNRVLAKRGLYMKCCDYYTRFEILSEENTEKKIKHFQRKSTNCTTAAMTLTAGHNKFNGSLLTPIAHTEVSCYDNFRVDRVYY